MLISEKGLAALFIFVGGVAGVPVVNLSQELQRRPQRNRRGE
jgi:hypothetical protein